MYYSASATVSPLVSIIKSSGKAIASDRLVSSKVKRELYSKFQIPCLQQYPCGQLFVILLSLDSGLYRCPVAEVFIAEFVQVNWTVEISQAM